MARAPIPVKTLSDEQRTRWRALLQQSFEAAVAFNGSEPSLNLVTKPLIQMEQKIMGDPPEGLNREQVFPRLTEQAWPDRPEEVPASINNMLDFAAKFYDRLQQADGIGELLPVLTRGGARMRPNNKKFFPPMDNQFQEPTEDDPSERVLGTQPRLAYLLRNLYYNGIYMDDLIITVEDLPEDEHAFRTVPYVSVQIPRQNVEILVCDQREQATFVSNRILGTALWAYHDKKTLEEMPGVTRRIFRDPVAWWENLGKDIFKGQPFGTVGKKVNLDTYLKTRKFDLDYDLIGKSIVADYQANLQKGIAREHAWPTVKSGMVQNGPYAGLIDYQRIELAATRQGRGLPHKSSLAALKEIYGSSHGYVNFKNQKLLDRDKLIESIKATYEATGQWPVVNKREGESGFIEHGPYKDSGETWAGVNAAALANARGLTPDDRLAALKQECGWVDTTQKTDRKTRQLRNDGPT